ncbi:hypothetical protein GCM10009821_00480 [Aeromicrobium halocynthiae]|uniref:DUF4235 domain-containing protein n=1 Tax=Aeromicrobium halocynthiae TaxID=560557 RepID=UPI0031DA9B1E
MARRRTTHGTGPSTTTATTSSRRSRRSGRGTWKVLDRTSTVAAGLLAREVAQRVWRITTGRKAPASGRHPEVETKEAVAWAIVGGAVVELVKMLVSRWVTGYWVRSTGKLPPGVKPLKTTKEPVPGGDPTPASSRRSSRRGR